MTIYHLLMNKYQRLFTNDQQRIMKRKYRRTSRRRAYPNDRLVMRPSEKIEAKAAGQKGSEAWSSHFENIFGRQRRHRALQPDAIEPVIWICSIITYSRYTLFMQNKPNFHKTDMIANLITIKDYEENVDFRHEKTKPIQTQFKANLSQNKPNTNPIQTQFKPKQSQFIERPKMNAILKSANFYTIGSVYCL